MSPRARVGQESPQTTLFVLAALVVVLWGLSEARVFFIPVSIAGVLAVLLTAFVGVFRRIGAPDWLAITLSTLGFLLPISSVLYLLGYEIQLFIGDLPRITESLNQFLIHLARTDLPKRFHLAPEEFVPHITQR